MGSVEDALFAIVWSVFIYHCSSASFFLELFSFRCPYCSLFLSVHLAVLSIFMMPTEQPPSDAKDIFSLSDRVLADKLQFVKEVCFSISVWLRRLMYPF